MKLMKMPRVSQIPTSSSYYCYLGIKFLGQLREEGSKRILFLSLLNMLWSCLLSTVDIALLTYFWNQEPKELDSIDLPPNYRTYRVLTRNKGTPTEWLDYLPNRPPLF